MSSLRRFLKLCPACSGRLKLGDGTRVGAWYCARCDLHLSDIEVRSFVGNRPGGVSVIGAATGATAVSARDVLLSQLKELVATDALPPWSLVGGQCVPTRCLVANSTTWRTIAPLTIGGYYAHYDDQAPDDVVCVFARGDCPICQTRDETREP